MKYLLQKYDGDRNRYDVINDDSDLLAACVYPLKRDAGRSGYRVEMMVPFTYDEYPEVVIKSIDEAIPAVAAYYEANPPRWEPESDLTPGCPPAMGPCRARYFKNTQFGYLWVGQIKSRQWVAYRDGHALSHADGKTANFATREEAQRAADAHFRDGYPNSKMANDGLTWSVEYEWWLDPYRPANRARWAVV